MILDKATRAQLRARIRGTADESHTLRRRKNRIVMTFPIEKIESALVPLDRARRALAIDARHHLIAYGLLRGLEYTRIEHSCRAHNGPNVLRVYAIIQEVGMFYDKKVWTLENVTGALRRSDNTESAKGKSATADASR